jgi:hypothetical protein
VGNGLRGREDEGNVNNVQYKSNWNCHFESPLYNEYILIKAFKKKIPLLVKKAPSYSNMVIKVIV